MCQSNFDICVVLIHRVYIEAGIDLHDGEVGRQLGRVDFPEAVLVVEAVRRQEFVGGAQVETPHAACPRPVDEGVQQALRGATGSAAVAGGDEHLAQRAFAIADVQEADRADHHAAVQRHPELALALLVKAGNIQQVGLVGELDRDPEFQLLDRQDDGDDAVTVARVERRDQMNPRTGRPASRWIQFFGEYAVRPSVTCRVKAWRDTGERFGAE